MTYAWHKNRIELSYDKKHKNDPSRLIFTSLIFSWFEPNSIFLPFLSLSLKMARQRSSKSFGRGKVGSGSRFKACMRRMRARKGIRHPAGLCATIGRRKYGKKRFQKMASKGRRN